MYRGTVMVALVLCASPCWGQTVKHRVLVLPAVKGLPPSVLDGSLQQTIEQTVARSPEAELRPSKAVRQQLLSRLSATDEDPVPEVLAEARAHYLAQRFEPMRRALLAAEQKHLALLAQPRRVRQAAALNRLLGVALAIGGQTDQAAERFACALDLVREDDLDETLYPPGVVALFRTVRAQRTSVAPLVHRLDLPPRTRVTVDGKACGVAASELRILPGRHYLRFLRLGYRSGARIVVLPTSRPLSVRLEALSPGQREEQLARWLEEGLVDAEDSDHLRALARVAGADRILRWQLVGGRLKAELLASDSGKPQRMATVELSHVTRLWQLLTRPLAIPPSSTTSKPLWQRWWVWTLGAAVVGGVVTGLVLGLQGDPVVQVQVQP